ncbi:MAG: hypothetical protein Q8O86_08935 [Dehalococcoidia bacterium]|nr:hypothetical protein [Dehalococcoidia bacterium]
MLNVIAAWVGWPVIVAMMLLAGGYVGWLQKNRIEQLKEINGMLQLRPLLKTDPSTTGIKITFPRNGDKVQDFFTASGIYRNKPTNARLELLVIARGSGFWPSGIASFDDENNTWYAEVHVGGNSGAEATIIAAVVGAEGQALSDYYRKVGRETDQWPAIERLTSDVSEVYRVTVVHK